MRWGISTVAICAALCGNQAIAQVQETTGDRTSQTAGDTAATDTTATTEVETDDIVVTGSRIRRLAADSATPTSIINSEQIRAAGRQQIADVINQQPALAITQSDQTSNLAGNAGVNALDLRGLGTNRTLVLVDGRRHVPGVPGSAAVDISTIPSNLVERVEIITGGASALYGADAVAGVANFILKKKYQGLDSTFYYGQSTRGDMYNYNFDLLGGLNFAEGRGNVTGFVSYGANPDTVSGQDRPWTRGGFPLYVYPQGSRTVQNVRDNNYNVVSSPGATVLLGGKLYTFDAAGRPGPASIGPSGLFNVRPQDPQGSDLSDQRVLGGLLTDGGNLGGRYDGYYLQTPFDRFSSHASVNYDLTDSLTFFAQGEYASNTSTGAYLALAGYGGDYVPADSPYITPAIRALAPIPAEGIAFGRRFNEFGVARSLYKRNMLQTAAGFNGKFRLFDKPWTWSAYYTYGETRVQTRQLGAISFDRYLRALDTTTGPGGQAICRSTLDTPLDGCVPLNPFQTVTQQAREYIQYDSSFAKASLQQQVASAYATGGLFDLPGGPFQVSLGAEYRDERNNIGATPEFDPTSPKYVPDYGVTETSLIGKFNVAEVFGEVDAPLLRNVPFFNLLSLQAAARLSDYNTAGRTTTYKVGGEWAPIRDIRFRATYGQAVRAPNISELFTKSSISGLYLTDPCNTYNLRFRATRTQYTAANCAKFNPSDKDTFWLYRDIIAQGNPTIGVETARTLTAGVVLQPRFIKNLSLTVDYYNIDLQGAIGILPAQTLVNRCVDEPTTDNRFCGFVNRDARGNLESVITRQINLSQYLTRGIDFAGVYRLPLSSLGLKGDSGELTIDAAYTLLLKRQFILDPTSEQTITNTVGVFGSPKWKGVIRTSYGRSDFGLSWTVRHYSSMRASSQIDPARYSPAFTGDVFYNDVSAWVKLTKSISLFGGLNNALDRAPPRIPGAEAGGANFELGYQAGVYDVIGRTLFAGIRFTR